MRVLASRAVVGIDGDAERQRAAERALRRLEELLLHLGADALGEHARAGEVGALEDDGELLAAVARRQVDLAHAVAHDGGHAACSTTSPIGWP